jgi:hypothetical protein
MESDVQPDMTLPEGWMLFAAGKDTPVWWRSHDGAIVVQTERGRGELRLPGPERGFYDGFDTPKDAMEQANHLYPPGTKLPKPHPPESGGESVKEAGPWAWFEEYENVAVRSAVSPDVQIIAEISKPLGIEWEGWVMLHGAKRILRGDSAEDVMGRIDAILESDGWTLRPVKKPVTAERVVDALWKDPKLAMEVRELLSKRFSGL